MLRIRRKTWIYKAASVLIVLSCTGCLSWFFSSIGFDTRPITIQTLSLFNQRDPSKSAKTNWKGDWVFRRQRLELVDKTFHDIKPDILALQQTLARKGSRWESDRNILMAGALNDYEWDQRLIKDYSDTQENEYLAVAVGKPLKLMNVEKKGERDFWLLGNDGYMSVKSVSFEGQAVTVFNVQMPEKGQNIYLWYSFIQERILDRIQRHRHCPMRIIVAGHLPGDLETPRYNSLVSTLQLKDVSFGFCEIAARCFTATSTNDIFRVTKGEESSERRDRILVHQSAYVYSSGRNFTNSSPDNRYVREFGLNRVWPTQRFGWKASVRLARCGEDEL